MTIYLSQVKWCKAPNQVSGGVKQLLRWNLTSPKTIIFCLWHFCKTIYIHSRIVGIYQKWEKIVEINDIISNCLSTVLFIEICIKSKIKQIINCCRCRISGNISNDPNHKIRHCSHLYVCKLNISLRFFLTCRNTLRKEVIRKKIRLETPKREEN